MRAARYVTWMLIALLVLVTPGGSTCLPLPSGRHVHIAWSDHAGHNTPGPVIFTHDKRQPAFHHLPGRAYTAAMRGTWATTILPADNDTPPLVAALNWQPPTAALLWLAWSPLTESIQPGPGPLLPPPRPA